MKVTLTQTDKTRDDAKPLRIKTRKTATPTRDPRLEREAWDLLHEINRRSVSG